MTIYTDADQRRVNPRFQRRSGSGESADFLDRGLRGCPLDGSPGHVHVGRRGRARLRRRGRRPRGRGELPPPPENPPQMPSGHRSRARPAVPAPQEAPRTVRNRLSRSSRLETGADPGGNGRRASRMEPGAAGLSGRDEAFGAESSFQALRGHGRGHVGMERGQTPPNATKSTSRVPGSGSRISLPFCGFPVSTGRPRATKRYGDGVGSDPPSA